MREKKLPWKKGQIRKKLEFEKRKGVDLDAEKQKTKGILGLIPLGGI